VATPAITAERRAELLRDPMIRELIEIECEREILEPVDYTQLRVLPISTRLVAQLVDVLANRSRTLQLALRHIMAKDKIFRRRLHHVLRGELGRACQPLLQPRHAESNVRDAQAIVDVPNLPEGQEVPFCGSRWCACRCSSQSVHASAAIGGLT
jgi:hypothetical protein